MALQTSRIFSLLFVIAVAIVLLILSWGYLSTSISWTAFSENNRHQDEDSLLKSYIELWVKKGNSTHPPAVFTTTHKAKIADSTKTNQVTKLKTDQMRASTHGAVAETPIPVLLKKSFKKLPQWDFEDVYNQDAPPRQTTCAQSLRNSEDESFKKAFLPNIRLFLHKNNFNMSEWNRLSHFNNPFGFMEYQYNDMMSSLKMIPKPKEPLLLPKPGNGGCVRCAVVGTGGILNGSKMGKEIDAHDYVFRMNGAAIKGYEEDVGNRTSVYVHTAHSITMSLYLFKKYGYTSAPHDEGIKYVMIPEGVGDFNWLEGLLKGERVSAGPYHNKRPWTYYGGQYNESRFYVLHQDFLRYVRNRFLKSAHLNNSYWAIVRPTNGAFALFLALHTCDTVSAYGFMTEDYKKYSNYYVEKNIKTHVVFYANHDYILEMNLWKKLHNSKIMRLYQRTDSETGTEKPKQL
ncbi:alpha-N-acetylgalactosaminide alpha-2,6-sialyltransferase 2-like isoform X2 [Siniperca chuatsi]|uniref:alpha-N-acetylgalactosaminide alpha-2,6-sialyltransferase 2-like isoform X2 n=1 Tax=Siniperca chuatsi TaxID=119488 RepID=UPI001CE0BD4D|nr:alpha-N-acetylgalactosaminide alpha-2,6-sialyltransferase 2-like isoform X2 [Siniperca chuatsi]